MQRPPLRLPTRWRHTGRTDPATGEEVLARVRPPQGGFRSDPYAPLVQALEDFVVFLILIAIERRLDRWPDGTRRIGYPSGIVIGTGMILWGIERSLDEHLWLGEDGRLGSDLVQLAGVLLVVAGAVILVRARTRWRDWLLTHHAGDSSQSVEAGSDAESESEAADSSPSDALATRGETGPAM